MEIDRNLGALFISGDELEAINRVDPDTEVNRLCRISNFVHRCGKYYFRLPESVHPEFECLIDTAAEADLVGSEPERFQAAARQAKLDLTKLADN